MNETSIPRETFRISHRLRWFVALVVVLSASLAGGEPSERHWLGLFVGESRIGYAWYEDRATESGGKLILSETVIKGTVLGQSLSLSSSTRTAIDRNGEILTIESENESGDRTVVVRATRSGNRLQVERNQGDQINSSTVDIDPSLPFTQDPLESLIRDDRPPLLGTRQVQTFDPNLLDMVTVEVINQGEKQIETVSGTVTAIEIEIKDPRSPTLAYVSAKGDLIKIIGPLGIEFRPESESQARRIGENTEIDLADRGSIVPDRPLIGNPHAPLTIAFRGLDRLLPSDGHQTVETRDDETLVTIHPVPIDFSKTLSEARRGPDEWKRAEPRMPSDDPLVREEAAKIIGLESKVGRAVELLRLAVHHRMRVNAGIGVLREFDEIWSSSEGVCRDHAIALGTLIRAVDIPTRLVSGLIYANGRFYYHAWVEYWNGSDWIGADSTRPAPGLTSHHIKVGQGTIVQAYGGFLLNGATMRVVKESQ
ncbi:MAG: transglutaminase family protein [Fimbriimonadaceae bacterium]|nr:transglutaminase family protein [Fimbriimonadaceae bacterium]